MYNKWNIVFENIENKSAILLEYGAAILNSTAGAL